MNDKATDRDADQNVLEAIKKVGNYALDDTQILKTNFFNLETKIRFNGGLSTQQHLIN